jgi:hypothetical protein
VGQIEVVARHGGVYSKYWYNYSISAITSSETTPLLKKAVRLDPVKSLALPLASL